ncbi:MAG: hypothetical protein FWE90_00945 [Defluviitaleaceae bacterium]|nr:hypothetical protein [Defluviitaleaceae bacterium]
MVATISKTRSKPTRDEAFALIDAATRIADFGESIPCPRCGQPLIYEDIGNSFIVECTDETCIRTGCRGI